MVTILDRTGEHQEFRYNNVAHCFTVDKNTGKQKTTQVLPLEVATWMFTVADHRHRVHTTEGDFVRRYGVVDAPEDWVAIVGLDVLETSPLTRDATRVEGWDAEAVRDTPVTLLDLKTTAHRPRSGEYVNQGTAGGR